MTAADRHAKREQFFEAFGAHVQCIAAMEVPQVSQGSVPFETFRALLICTHLDTLAKARYGGKSTGERFARLLEHEAGQDRIYRLVALYRLHGHLRQLATRRRALARSRPQEAVDLTADADELDRAGAVVAALLQERQHDDLVMDGVFASTSIDVPAQHLTLRLCAAGTIPAPRSSLWRALEEERYSTILWRDYRCALVHETRVVDPGFNPHPYADREPFYFTHLESSGNVPKLVIPTRFLLRTLRCALDRYRQDCERHDLDPYDALGIR